ncbi:MAG: hypothetical protein KatS3mg081_1491 [Gemmatimonadales bacterium]|nr:hypothetical protein HRbin33_00708 [bacterium HR33]GIW52136.1 MAG: hypothetical protein KatS3mg081_1491 [Gemmatimonadales bacterium]
MMREAEMTREQATHCSACSSPGPRITRRVFVKASGIALVGLGLDPIFLTRAAYAVKRSPSARGKTLVCIFQRGAVDGLNMIVPHGEEIYYRERPRIAVPRPGKPGGAIDLDGHFGMHPALEPLEPYYRNGTLAVVHAVGSPDPTRSHFEAQDYMETGTPGIKSTGDGWLNRYLAHAREHRDTPFRGVAIGRELPRALRGAAPALALENLETFGVRAPDRARDRLTRAFEELYSASSTGLVATSSAEALEAIKMLREIDPERYRPAAGAEYPASPLGRSLRQIAQLIKADLGVEVAFADVGGWDTHVNQGGSEGQLAARLRDFAQSLAAFARDLGERLADVVVLTMSEFGRTVAENGNLGTDHGRATAMLVLGGATRGGRVLGRWPTLDPARRFEGRDLAVTTDFRDLFGEVLVKHLGPADLSAIFPGFDAAPERWPGVFG